MPRKKESKRNKDMQVLILPSGRMRWNQTAPEGYDGKLRNLADGLHPSSFAQRTIHCLVRIEQVKQIMS